MDQVALNLPTKSDTYTMPESVFAAYRKLYPSAEYEFARMLIWLETNPARRPASAKSAPRFVENWFKRVPRIAPRAEARLETLAALTGRNTNVVSIGRGHDWPTFRPNDRRVGRAEDVIDVDGIEHRGGGADLGTHALPLFSAGTASGG